MSNNIYFKKLLLIHAFAFVGFNAISQDFKWAKGAGSAEGNEVGTSVVIDAIGNSYTTGYFYGTVDFDPGDGIKPMTSAGDADIFILKLNAAGIFVWAQRFGSTGEDKGMGIALDGFGNMFIAGSFSETVDFNPGLPEFNLVSLGQTDIFYLKLDPGVNFVTAQRKGGRTKDAANAIAVDAIGNVFLTGTFSGLSGNPGDEWVSIKGSPDVFVSKININGLFEWSKFFGDVGNDYGKSITLDVNGNVYTTGSFSGSFGLLDIGIATYYIASAGKNDAFILKTKNNGLVSWFKNLGGPEDDFGNSIALDASGNVYTTGSFVATADFDPGKVDSIYNLTSAGGADIFISKLNTDAKFLWAKRMGGPEGDVGNSLKLDGLGNIYTTGFFNSTADFDPGVGVVNLTSAGSTDIFVSKLNSMGEFLFAKNMGGPLEDVGNSIAADNEGKSYSTGFFKGTADFDPGPNIYNLVSFGLNDMYVSLLGPTAPSPVLLLNFTVTKKLDNVVLSWQTATESNSDRFEIERSVDGKIFNKIGEVKASGNSNSIKSYEFTDKNPINGLNVDRLYYRFRQFDSDGNYFISPVRAIDLGKENSAMYLFPNPVISTTTIHAIASQPGVDFTITDGKGRKVLTGKLNNNSTIIDVSQLAPGIYFINIGGHDRKTLKMVKL